MAHLINGTSSPAEVNAFLDRLAGTNPRVQIYTREVCSRNPKGRTLQFGPNSNEYGICSQAAYLLKQPGTLYMVASPPNINWKRTHAYRRGHPHLSPEALAALQAEHAEGSAEWHCFGVLVRRNVMHIYDSAYPNLINPDLVLGPTQVHQIGHFANLNQARTLLQEILSSKGKAAVTTIYIGGGGNTGDMNACRSMTAQWLERMAGLVQAAEAERSAGEGEAKPAEAELAGALAELKERIQQ